MVLGEQIFFRVKPINTIIALNSEKQGWYASSLAKKVDCTFPHMTKLLSGFKELGLVSFKEEGRKKMVLLTSKGKKLATSFSTAFEALE